MYSGSVLSAVITHENLEAVRVVSEIRTVVLPGSSAVRHCGCYLQQPYPDLLKGFLFRSGHVKAMR